MCSMSGINPHSALPPNPLAPDRLPGGSSSGSAAAVASGFVEVALGTDTSGSVRLPAAWCGLYGMRPTHGALSLAGVFPLAPSFDTVGWMARELSVLRRLGEVLLEPTQDLAYAEEAVRIVVARDALAWVSPAMGEALVAVVQQLGQAGVPLRAVSLYDDMRLWLEAHTAGVHAECVEQHARWLRTTRPRLGDEVAERFRDLEPPHPDRRAAAEGLRARVRAQLLRLLDGPVLLCMPTTHDGALPRTASRAACNDAELYSLVLGCVASLSGACQITCPWASVDGIPVGLSFVARPGADRWLLRQVAALAARLGRS
jgi:amidase